MDQSTYEELLPNGFRAEAKAERRAGLAGLVADVLADNYFLLPLLARVGPVATTFAYSGYRVRVGFRPPFAGAAVRGDFPVWGSE